MSLSIPLYRLPELLAADPERTVLLVEGEKDVDQAIQAGLIATTNSRGAKGFQQHMVSWLAGRKVLIVADNDSAGVEGAQPKSGTASPTRQKREGRSVSAWTRRH